MRFLHVPVARWYTWGSVSTPTVGSMSPEMTSASPFASVVVVGSGDGRTLKTEVMRYRQAANEVSSDQPFVFDGPGRHMEGAGFTSDPNFRNVIAVRPRGKGAGIVLPTK